MSLNYCHDYFISAGWNICCVGVKVCWVLVLSRGTAIKGSVCCVQATLRVTSWLQDSTKSVILWNNRLILILNDWVLLCSQLYIKWTNFVWNGGETRQVSVENAYHRALRKWINLKLSQVKKWINIGLSLFVKWMNVRLSVLRKWIFFIRKLIKFTRSFRKWINLRLSQVKKWINIGLSLFVKWMDVRLSVLRKWIILYHDLWS